LWRKEILARLRWRIFFALSPAILIEIVSPLRVFCVVFTQVLMEKFRFTIGKKLHHKKYGTEYNSFDALCTAFADSDDSDEAFCNDNSFE
jgi:hypothetical protein